MTHSSARSRASPGCRPLGHRHRAWCPTWHQVLQLQLALRARVLSSWRLRSPRRLVPSASGLPFPSLQLVLSLRLCKCCCKLLLSCLVVSLSRVELSARQLTVLSAGSQVASAEHQALWRQGQIRLCGGPEGGYATRARPQDCQGASVLDYWPSAVNLLEAADCVTCAKLLLATVRPTKLTDRLDTGSRRHDQPQIQARQARVSGRSEVCAARRLQAAGEHAHAMAAGASSCSCSLQSCFRLLSVCIQNS